MDAEVSTHTFLTMIIEDSIKYTDAEGFMRLILGDGVVWTLDKVY